MTDAELDDVPDYCPNCGAESTGAGTFCGSCGEPLIAPATRPMRPVAPPPRAPILRRRGPPLPEGASDHSVLAIFAVGLALILLLVGVALYVGGVVGSSNAPTTVAAGTSTPASTAVNTNTSGGTTPTYTAPTGSEHTGSTFTGQVFSIEYPSGWRVRNNEKQQSWGTDTTIVSPADSNTYLRVDVAPNTTATDPRASAQPVISQLEKASGYQLLGLNAETINGVEALNWDFRVEESGVMLQKEDVFLIAHNRDGVAVLTQAPASEYEASRSQFAALRKSLSMSGA
jgi:hypothetical protein